MKLVGYRRVDISRKEDGSEIHGYNLYCTYPSQNVTGEATERLWVHDKVLGDGAAFLRVGAEITPVYNKFGKIAGIQFCD